MQEWMIGIILFVVLELVGGMMFRSHLISWKQAEENPKLDEAERTFRYRQFRRRRQTSALIMLLGVMLPCGLLLFTFKLSPWIPTVYWIVVLLLTFWICLLAVGDLLVSAAHVRRQLTAVTREQIELQQHLKQAQQQQAKKHQSNGHH